MFETIEYIEVERGRGGRNPAPYQRVVGTFEVEAEAIEAGRAARSELLEKDGEAYAWWVVRKVGAPIAQWIADSHNPREFVLDLTSGELVEVE